MNEIIKTSDISINFKSFGITQKEIEDIKKENNIYDENNIIIGLIIGKIRRTFIKLHLSNISFNDLEINEIIEILKLPLNIDSEFKSFEDLGQHIFHKYDFKDIDNYFLNNEVQIETFIIGVHKFLNNIDNQPKISDKIINSLQEL